jgi:cobalt-zinc-cadmium efflux system outer membrane protein
MNKSLLRFFFSAFSLLVNNSAWSNALVCEKLSTPNDLVSCALTRHPTIQRADLDSELSTRLEAVAEQRPNPEFNLTSVFGTSLGDYVLSHQANLAIPIEFGEKRGARIEKALAQKSLVDTTSLQSREQVLLEMIRNLFRLRQIQTELDALSESLATFSKIRRQIQVRPTKTPEQKVSLSLFSLAEGDYKLRRSTLEAENFEIVRQISTAIGKDFIPQPHLLPPRRRLWPKISGEVTESQIKGSLIRVPEAQVEIAQADYSVAKGTSWPTLRIGPSLQSQTQGPFTYHAFGLNLSFDLPLFQANSAGRAYARLNLEYSEKKVTLRRQELLNLRLVLQKKYLLSVKAFEDTLSLFEVEKQHRSSEALFLRGIIPTELVIEAHRQIVEFTQSRNQLELSATLALWGIFILDGRAFEEKMG